MADDGGDVILFLFRNNSYLNKSQKYSKIQLTIFSVSGKSMLIRKLMPYIQKKKPTHR